MKKIIILFSCFFSLMVVAVVSCDKSADLQSNEVFVPGDDTPDVTGEHTPGSGHLSERVVTDCSACPMGDCCCSMQRTWATLEETTVVLCGTTDGTDACGPLTPPGSCPTISGGGQTIVFNLSTTKVLFCMDPSSALAIRNASAGTVGLRITCDQSATINDITVNSGATKYMESDGNCGLDDC